MDSAIGKKLLPVDIEEEMKTSFISYAMAVIINRALPDVRDGLKPVHRRILYSMHELGFSPDKPFRKCARIVGDVLGKYHPHGDSAVYESMVRMAQNFSIRCMLVDGHGNFGSVDGDSAAAMRYTEARLSKLSMEMLADIEKETVDYYPNFDNTLMQPAVMPSRFPNLLVNGSGGIAVGMATNIPPHNLGEAIDACVLLIDDPEADMDALMEKLPGPDFPTGGIIAGMSGIREAYRTGRGRIVVRAKAEIEQFAANRSRIIVSELPYQVNKARLVEKIADLVHDKKLEGISDLRDESDRTGMRVVIELKKDINANIVLNYLYKHTQMQETFGVIMIALVNGEPKVLDLKQILYHYIQHQKDVVTRRTRFELEKAKARAHILEGLIIALDNIDEVVALIKASRDVLTAKAGLMERFGLSEKQAQAILDMRLQRLTGLEREKIQEECRQLQETIAYLTRVLENEALLFSIIREEMLEIKRKYADKRRTEISMILDDEIDLDDIIQEEEMAVTLTHFGYIKRLPSSTYRSQRRGGRGVTGLTTREADFVENIFIASTHAYILFFTNLGRVFRLKCYEIPEAGRQAKGMAIVNLLQLQGGEKVTAAFPADEAGKFLTMATKNGMVKKTQLGDFTNIRRSGLIAIELREGDELISVRLTGGHEKIIIGSRNGMSIVFPEGEIRPMGRTAMGVHGIRLGKGDIAVDMDVLSAGTHVLVISENGYGKRTPTEEYPVQHRDGKGVLTLNATDKTGPLSGLKMISSEDDIILINDEGTVIRMDVSEISSIGRNTQGVRVMRVAEETRVVCVAKVSKETAEEDTGEIVETAETVQE
ncbi:MAG: DNA gyrase subunit A [Bacillota bacterium]|nr:DNA gyrase subunit A [Bacillota bacterium]